MRRRLSTRAAILVLAWVVPLTGIRAAAASCCVADCHLPCCDRDDAHSTMVPVLPCCRTEKVASMHPAPTTVENDQAPLLAPTVVAWELALVPMPASLPMPSARMLPAPPLYHQHCALLL